MSLTNWISHKIYLYELWTGLYMLDPWEKALFNLLVASVAGFSSYYTYKYVVPEVAKAILLS